MGLSRPSLKSESLLKPPGNAELANPSQGQTPTWKPMVNLEVPLGDPYNSYNPNQDHFGGGGV